ncbi:MAG TPA: hypothetical protein VM328_07405 [Fimbriimonadaceae bacterium]|nr:hypothetical protein [Fimbriimonadaceae bacterium]
MSLVRNSVQHPDASQQELQSLIWAMLSRTKFNDLQPPLKVLAAKLLTPKQIVDLNGGALGLLTDDKIGGAFLKQPPLLRQVLEAEARLRNMLTNPASSFEELERVAILTGEVGIGPGSRNVPAGRWSLHPDGYYVRYLPSGYSTTRVEIWVPEDSKAIGKEFDPATHVAVPGNTSRQRLLMSGRYQTDH